MIECKPTPLFRNSCTGLLAGLVWRAGLGHSLGIPGGPWGALGDPWDDDDDDGDDDDDNDDDDDDGDHDGDDDDNT